MLERIIGAVGGGLRIALLVAALVVALLPIARGATVGFCPPDPAEEDAAATVVAAAPMGPLAAVVQPSTEESTGTDEPTDGATATEPEEPGASEGDEAVVDAGPCGPGVDECLPPLLSAVLEFGDESCGSEAVSRLRGSMIPAFLIASALLVGAWALRPRDGAPVISRW